MKVLSSAVSRGGKMGQVISGLIAADPDMELVAGIDARDDGQMLLM